MQALSPLRYLALPLRPAPLLLVAIFSLLLVVAASAGVFGFPMLAIVGSWFLKYAFLMLDHAAQGRPDAPVLAPEHANPLGEMRPLIYGFAILAFLGLTEAIGGVAGAPVASVLRLLGMAALPAVLATHSITGSFASALNPATLLHVTRRLGSGYLLLAACAVAGWWLGQAIALDAGHLSLLLRIALLMLLWLALFSLLGGILHDRRVELGYEPEHSPERTQQRENEGRDRERERFMDQLFAECRSGSTRNAAESIRHRASAAPRPIDEYQWIHARVGEWPAPRLAEWVARELLPLQLAAGRTGEALEVVRQRVRANPEFRPHTGAEVVRLAELARDAGDRPVARTLLLDFVRRFPGDAAAPAARRLAEQLDPRQDARPPTGNG